MTERGHNSVDGIARALEVVACPECGSDIREVGVVGRPCVRAKTLLSIVVLGILLLAFVYRSSIYYPSPGSLTAGLLPVESFMPVSGAGEKAQAVRH